MTDGHNPQLNPVVKAFQNRNVDRVFFVACGGSSALMYPSKYVLDREATTITSDLYSSNEFIHRNPRTLSQQSLVILCTLSGTTPETVEAAKFARSKGALTIGLTNDPESPLAKASEFVVKFEWGVGKDAFDSNYSYMYQIVFGLLKVKEGNPKFDAIVNSLSVLQPVFDKARKQYQLAAEEFATDYKDEKVIYTMASGASYGVAYSYAICILMEMQWIHSHAIHAGEYFH